MDNYQLSRQVSAPSYVTLSWVAYAATTMMSSIILQGGTVLYHNEDDSVSAIRDTDVLITGTTITDIAKNIPVPASSDCRVIDCSAKIICPGFIDCHHHPWCVKSGLAQDT